MTKITWVLSFWPQRLAVKARCNVPKSTPLVGEALAQAHTPALLIPFVLWHPIAPRDSELVAAMASGDTLAVDLTKPVSRPKQHLAPLAGPPSAGHPPRSRWRKADRLRHARWALQHPAVLPAQMHGETNLPTYPPFRSHKAFARQMGKASGRKSTGQLGQTNCLSEGPKPPVGDAKSGVVEVRCSAPARVRPMQRRGSSSAIAIHPRQSAVRRATLVERFLILNTSCCSSLSARWEV